MARRYLLKTGAMRHTERIVATLLQHARNNGRRSGMQLPDDQHQRDNATAIYDNIASSIPRMSDNIDPPGVLETSLIPMYQRHMCWLCLQRLL